MLADEYEYMPACLSSPSKKFNIRKIVIDKCLIDIIGLKINYPLCVMLSAWEEGNNLLIQITTWGFDGTEVPYFYQW